MPDRQPVLPARRIAVIDDDPDFLSAVSQSLTDVGYDVAPAPSATDALRLLDAEPFDLVLTDIRMPERDGISLCSQIVGEHPGVPVVVMTAYGDLASAVSALRAGATDFIAKPFTLRTLALTVERALLSEASRAKRLPSSAVSGEGELLLGESPAIQELRHMTTMTAATDATVLISGESGTGKELVARTIHRKSRRRSQPFLAVNCAAMPMGLLESELFGHARGAFTGAEQARRGLLLEAGEGTLFLDEVGAMPLALQAKLLRALEERKVRPVGASGELPFGARILAATNRELREAVDAGAFRQELLYRLAVIRIDVPPLRERDGDVLLLARHFLARLSNSYELSSDAISRIKTYSWPGNVRELENCVVAAFTMSRSGRIGFEDLPTLVRAPRGRARESDALSLEDQERRHVLHVLESLNGNKSQAARSLGINRATLYRKLKRWGFHDR